MPKRKRTTRKDILRTEDEFRTFSERAISFFREHLRLLIYLGVGIALAIGTYVGVETYLGHVDRQGQEAYNIAYYQVRKALQSKEGLGGLRQAEDAFKDIVEKHGWAKAARLALPQIAWAEYLDQDYEQAASYYGKFLHEVPARSMYQDMARLALASTYESEGELEKAIKTLNVVLENPSSLFGEFALFKLSRLYRLHGDGDKAKETLKRLAEEYENSPFLPIAKANL